MRASQYPGAGCRSWHETASETITNNWSSSTLACGWRTRRPKLDELEQAS